MRSLNKSVEIVLRVLTVWSLALSPSASAQQIDYFNAELVKREADYIINSQYWPDDPNDCAVGAINNIYDAAGKFNWVVPRENALAILGLVRASQSLGEAKYRERAQGAMGYLLRIQDSDGSWLNQYRRCQPSPGDEGQSKSPTQTAEVMIALNQLGYEHPRYQAMVKAAEFLLTLQDPANKMGLDDGLIGIPTSLGCTPYCKLRWTHDNAFAYQALNAAALWAKKASDTARQQRYKTAANRILDGINNYLKDPNSAVWYIAVDEQGQPICLANLKLDQPDYRRCELVQQQFYEWINYAPQMLDIPANGVGNAAVGEWIHNTLGNSKTGAVARTNKLHNNRLSPGYSFQASLVWLDLHQQNYYDATWNWVNASGLHQTISDPNGVKGGWIDWTERSDGQGECIWNQQPNSLAPCWERFIDTSFYAIAAATGGFDFSTAFPAYPPEPLKMPQYPVHSFEDRGIEQKIGIRYGHLVNFAIDAAVMQ